MNDIPRWLNGIFAIVTVAWFAHFLLERVVARRDYKAMCKRLDAAIAAMRAKERGE